MKRKLLIISDATGPIDFQELYMYDIVIVMYPAGHFAYLKLKLELEVYALPNKNYPAEVFDHHLMMCLDAIGVKPVPSVN
jgi:hypothetical protein